jgi:hypothetical protein
MKQANLRIEKKVVKDPNDLLYCEFCNTQYTRKNRGRHRRSKKCKGYQDLNNILREIVKGGIFDTKITMRDLIRNAYTDKKGNTVYLTKNQFNFFNKLNKPT